MNSGRRYLMVIMLASGLLGCGDVGTGVANPPSGPSSLTAAAAVGQLFNSKSSDGSTSLPVKWQATKSTSEGERTCDSNDPGCTCSEAASGKTPQDHPIVHAGYKDAGTYGSAESPLTMSVDDFCTQPDGTANTGSGPQGFGRFAGFTLTGDITANCTASDGTTTQVVMSTGSTGIWRNTIAAHTGTAHQPEIYGTFSLAADGATAATFRCTIIMGPGETILSSNCSDSTGTTVTAGISTTCAIQ